MLKLDVCLRVPRCHGTQQLAAKISDVCRRLVSWCVFLFTQKAQNSPQRNAFCEFVSGNRQDARELAVAQDEPPTLVKKADTLRHVVESKIQIARRFFQC